ncbi:MULTISPECIES: hypothetical protein [unclassified Haloarcula]|uniref:hypothetical protein n=1 Tax=unclassified Haloarcula TaxID=2624677 RepID=UPI0017820CAA|nr:MULTISPECIES: hypothetical protein [unclassified Haloarcula]
MVDPETGQYSGIITESDSMQLVAVGADIDFIHVAVFLSHQLSRLPAQKIATPLPL